MVLTLEQRLLQLEWRFHEAGMDAIWSELQKFAQSTIGTLTGATLFGDIDLQSATMVVATAGKANTGAPIPPSTGQPGYSGVSYATAPQGPPNVTNQPNTSGGETTNEPRVPTLNQP